MFRTFPERGPVSLIPVSADTPGIASSGLRDWKLLGMMM
jgi:hypothetical protein